ncbi:MAG: 50S ribosomal protein L25 [Bacteroidota bacterium]
MEKVILKASKRDVTGKQVKALRRSGLLPAVVYGRHVEPLTISLDAHDASLLLSRLTSSSLVTIELDGTEYPALVREKQRNFVKGTLLHVDFLAVNLSEKIRTNVRVEITGTSPAVKDFNAVLVTNITTIEVECLPSDLPERFTVDISPLKEVGDGIRVGDLAVPEDVRILTDPDEMIVVTTFAKAEEEVAPAAEAAAAEEPEVIEKGKKEEEGEEE